MEYSIGLWDIASAFKVSAEKTAPADLTFVTSAMEMIDHAARVTFLACYASFYQYNYRPWS